jgi:hypothetical protein
MDSKAAAERDLRARLGADEKLASARGHAWDDIAKAQARYREIYDRVQYLENGTGFNSDLFGYARLLVRGAAERAKPNEQRLREYADSNLPKVSAGLLAATPIHPEFETLTLGFSLDKLREVLGPDDDIVHRYSAGVACHAAAGWSRARSSPIPPCAKRCGKRRSRRRCSQDPMIVLARAVDPDALGRAQDLRRRSAGADRCGAGEDRQGTLRGAGHEGLPGCNVHSAAELWRRAGLGREGSAG